MNINPLSYRVSKLDIKYKELLSHNLFSMGNAYKTLIGFRCSIYFVGK